MKFREFKRDVFKLFLKRKSLGHKELVALMVGNNNIPIDQSDLESNAVTTWGETERLTNNFRIKRVVVFYVPENCIKIINVI